MSDFIDVFFQNILPIFLVAGIGFLLRTYLKLDKRTLSGLTFYALSPALVFTSLVSSKLDGDEVVQIALFTVIVTLLMGLVGLVAGILMRLNRTDTIALLLVLMFVNSGNYGLTLNQLRFGDEGLARAVVFFVVSTMLVFTLGVFIASLGQANWRDSLLRLLKLPAFYAIIGAMLVYFLDISVPTPILSSLEVAGSGAIPVMLVVLGMQIADLSGLQRIWLAGPASVLRLLIAPLVAVLVASWIGLEGISRSTSIIEASMPTAVITTIIATEFNIRPGLVTSTVVVSTLLSALILPLVITLFKL